MTKVTPYLRTEWAVQFPLVPYPVQYDSAFLAREASAYWNASVDMGGNYGQSKVVQRSISDWGDDE
jgi:hypothetical protein